MRQQGAIVSLATAIFYVCSLALACGVAVLLHRGQVGSVAGLSNFMGPLAASLAHGRGFVVCSDAMQTAGNLICFHANRMPLPPFLLAVLIRLFGAHALTIEVTKIALVLAPASAAFGLAWSQIRAGSSRSVRIVIALLLFFSLALPTQMIDAVNMQVEEGYSFCFLAYAVAVLLFGVEERRVTWRRAVWFALAVLALYLTKSSMILAAAFLVAAFCWRVLDRRKRVAVLLIALCGPAGWGLYTLHASGHFSTGTSVDGINLHKGNYSQFLDRYPPEDGGSMDRYDVGLNNGKYFADEWAFNRYHMHAAFAFMRDHPVLTMGAAFWKGAVFFGSLRKIGSARYAGWLGLTSDLSMLSFRLLLWGACIFALWHLGRRAGNWCFPSLVYLGTVAAVAAPYIAGFALTRHAGVLILPSALYLSFGIIHRYSAARV